MKRGWISIVLPAVLAGAAAGVQRFDLPEFKSDYRLPPTQTPYPRASWMEFVDLVLLLAALSVASWLALKKRSRRWIYVLMVSSLLYFGFYRQGCVCPIGAIQNVAYALFHPAYVIPVVVLAFFVAPLVFALAFGRAFCAAVCPLGAIQDVVAVKPVNVPGWLAHALGLLAYVYLACAVLFAATGATFIICQYDPFVSFFRVSGTLNMLILGACFLVIGLFVARPYCRFLCPYGALLRLVSGASRLRVTITPQECIKCRLCEDSCPFGAILKPTPEQQAVPRAEGKGRLAGLILLLPVLVAMGGWLGWSLGEPFSRMHYTVRLADRVYQEKTGQVQGTTDASAAFYATDRLVEELYQEARDIRAGFARAALATGAFVGLVIGLKLVQLSMRRRRTEYEADRGTCLACGRCFTYCPIEHRRRKQLHDRSPVRRV